MATQPEFKIDDYTKSVGKNLWSADSPLHDFPFTDSLLYDSQFEVDQQGVLTGGIVRTSRGEDRIQLTSRTSLVASGGSQIPALELYRDGVLRMALVEFFLAFYDAAGTTIGEIAPNVVGDIDIIANNNISLQPGGWVDVSANVIPNADNVYDLGDGSNGWRDGYFSGSLFVTSGVYTGLLGIVDGITAPSTIAGIAQIYVDTSDGDLKIKFGDGTVKTIVTD